LTGFNQALVEEDVEMLQGAVDRVEPERRCFAVEGAAMGAAIADALMLGGDRLGAWMRSNEAAYTYLTNVGAGWALARVPWRRRAILSAGDPVHGWLALDGLGFHDTYFWHVAILRGWRRRMRGYAIHAYDQGVGRALWFAAGGQIEAVSAMIVCFGPARHADLWSGLGLAITYAGGASASALTEARLAAGRFRASLAQGAAFAAEARARSNHVPDHTHQAVIALTGRETAAVVDLVCTLRARLALEPRGESPPYERWRRDVQRALMSA